MFKGFAPLTMFHAQRSVYYRYMRFKDRAFRTFGISARRFYLIFIRNWRECERSVLAFLSHVPPQGGMIWEGTEFVEITKVYAAIQNDRKTALNQAIDDCIEQNILATFLRTYRAEVLGMLLEEFDEKNMSVQYGMKAEKRVSSLVGWKADTNI